MTGRLRFLVGPASAVALSACASEPSLWITTESLPDGRVGFAYDVRLEVEDAEGQVDWSVAEGDLPPGLALSESGEIGGEVEGSGTFAFVARARDEFGADELDLEIRVPDVLLMSGFEPFDTYETNPSIEALRGLDLAFVAGLDVRVVELPVTWAGAWPALLAGIEAVAPAVVIATGVADTDAMRLEGLARNRQQGRDNDDQQPESVAIVEGGPETYETALPVEAMQSAMEAGGYRAVLSDNAGTYLCNHVFYQLMHHRAEVGLGPAGFVHVPPVPDSEYFALEDITAAHLLGVEAVVEWRDAGGTLKRNRGGAREAPRYGGD